MLDEKRDKQIKIKNINFVDKNMTRNHSGKIINYHDKIASKNYNLFLKGSLFVNSKSDDFEETDDQKITKKFTDNENLLRYFSLSDNFGLIDFDKNTNISEEDFTNEKYPILSRLSYEVCINKLK
jgi:hypothetical protein